jgi:hypothetical protein
MNVDAATPAPAVTPVAIAELEHAINRARSAQPAIGPGPMLTLEVSTLAALYGRLISERRPAVDLATLTTAERVALCLWSPPAAAAGRAG